MGLYYLLTRWFYSAFLILLTSAVLPGIEISGLYPALILALLWGFLNALIKPLLFFFTLPATVFSLGLFWFVVNGFLFWLPSTFLKGFEVRSFFWAMAGAFVISVFSWIGERMLWKRLF